MNAFTLDCACAPEPVEIAFAQAAQPRGKPAFRGFECDHEHACDAAGIRCALFCADGLEPFDVAQALRHLNG